ncbi:MAG: Ig-like domain-containing protein [Anaerolineae bacterium]|nr:Ig-like domain-containing protein [Anaerolineae bacterium]
MRPSKLTAVLLAVMVLATSCRYLPRPALTPTPTVRAPLSPLPPKVLQITPAPGEEHPLDAPVQLVFDQPMDAGAVESAFAIEPHVAGEFRWLTDRVVQFRPAGTGFKRATRYTVTLKENARSKEGLALVEPVQFRFTTVGFLEVATVQPADGATEVATDAVVTVLFNRPVVPLLAIEDQAGLPQPLTFDPPVKGKGEWLNTSIYTFKPDEGFDPATTYRARVAASLTDTTGGVMAGDFTWEFTTIMPAVAATYPDRDTIYVSTLPTVCVAFNQPMDHASAEAAFSLEHLDTGETVGGTFEWLEGGLAVPGGEAYEPYWYSWSEGEGPERVGVETMCFTPARPLDFGARYVAQVAQGARGAKGNAGTASAYKWAFDTIAYPRIVSTRPADGESGVDPWTRLEVVFSSPMDPRSISGNFTISPPVSPTQVYTYWWENDTHLEISFPTRASSEYAVTIGSGLRGRYGHPLEKGATIRWTTRAYDPLVRLNTPYPLGTYSAYTETMVYVTARNLGRVNLALYRIPAEDFLRLNGRDWWSYWENYRGSQANLVREWSINVAPPLNESRIYGTNLSGREGGALPPGIYYLEARGDYSTMYPDAAPPQYSEPERRMLIVSRHNLTMKTGPTEALVWATDLRSGDVLPGLPVSVMDETGQLLAEGKTSADGVFFGTLSRTVDMWEPLFAFVGDPDAPEDDFAAVVSQWDSGISPWMFDLPVEYYPSRYRGYLYTDRPIYRPGQTVYFKGILRQDDDAHYELPLRESPIHVNISDPEGKSLFSGDFTLSDIGTFYGEFTLDEEAPLGYYTIEATYLVDKSSYFYASFQVAEYRKPEFQVTVEADKPAYVHGDRINVTAQASYFFGGPVANAQVRYNVLSADYSFYLPGQWGWDFNDYDYDSYWYWMRGRYSAYGELIASGSGTTDAQGRFTFSLDADIAESTTSRHFTLEVTVTDVNNQEVSNRTEAVVHKGLYYIGLRPGQYVGTAGKENRVNVLTVDWAGEPSPNREVTIICAEYNWYNVQKQGEDGRYYWESVVEEKPVYTTTVTTDADGKASAAFVPEKGGVYRIVARGKDERGNAIRSATYMWVSGEDYVSWRQENNDRINLIADKKLYQVGETASILIPHPFQGPVKALITVERGHIYRHWVETLETNSEQIRLPITEELIPNVFVSVVIVKGIDETSRLPNFKVGYAQLSIDPKEKQLTITLTPDKAAGEHYQPGETVTYDVKVSDSRGRPVEAELSLDLVDLAVLTLAEEGGDISDYFWQERGLGVRTACDLTLSGDRLNEQIAAEVKGIGGGGGGMEGFGPVRHRFPDTAYWNPALRTDKNGRATLSITLPDNLTTWRLTARGVTARTLTGQAFVDVVSTKDLLVRPVAPRFFIVGDRAELAAVVHNNTDRNMDVAVHFEAEGVKSDAPANRQVTIPAHDRVKLTWPVTVDDVVQATLRFGARVVGEEARAGDSYVPLAGIADAVEVTLPVYRYSTPEVVATAGVFDTDGQRIEAVVLPPSFDITQGELAIHIDPSLAAGMTDGLHFLEHFPYECIEQTVSRFLPNVVTYRAFKALGLERHDLEEKLPGLVYYGLQRIYNQQHYDGGWGWWSVDKSDPFLTAYVLLGLVEAEKAGFTVDAGVKERALEFLKNNLSQARDVQEHWQANRRAFILYVLAEAGQGDLSRSITLFEQRERLDTFGKAYLAMALGLLQPDEPVRVKTLLSDITAEAIVSATGAHWEEEQVDYYSMNTDTRSTAIVLAALTRLDPDNALAPSAVRWLMSVRKDGHWETTQETVWSIIALTDWMVATGELAGAYHWHVILNDKELGAGSVSRENIDETVKLQAAIADLLMDEANRVVIERWAPPGQSSGTGRLYYSLYLRYFKPVEQITALNRGIIVSRQYRATDCGTEGAACPLISEAQVGQVIQVRLTIIAPHDLHYVVVEDPFPAGAEGVDQSLKTTSVVGEPPALIRTDRRDLWGDWGWWWFSHSELRDEKLVLFASYLPRGTYEYTYLIRASVPGEFRVIPTLAYEMYFPEVFGRGDGMLFTIK